jgi:peptide/nickel transport system permease protein
MFGGMSLLRYAVFRLALAAPTLLILLTVVFFVLRIIPGNPMAKSLNLK